MFGVKFLKGKWLKIDIDQIVWITDAVQLKQLYVIAGGVVLQVHELHDMYVHVHTHSNVSAHTYTYTYHKSKKICVKKIDFKTSMLKNFRGSHTPRTLLASFFNQH